MAARGVGADPSPAVRVARPAWVNARTVLGVLLFSVAFLAGQKVLSEASSFTTVWSAAADLEQGSTLVPSDLTAAEVRLPDDQLTRYATSSIDPTGSILTRPVLAGELIPSAWVVRPEDAAPSAEVSIPVTPERAAGGNLRAGDRVIVYAAYGTGRTVGRTDVVIQSAEVVGVVKPGGIVQDEQLSAVVVAVSPEEAGEIVRAVANADIYLVKMTGAIPPSTGNP